VTGRGRTLPRRFYARDPRDLAPQSLNKLLVATGPEAGSAMGRVAARIVEVEAYLGSLDPASHAFRGRTPRNGSMFGPPGHLYMSFTYGIHWYTNVVASLPGDAGAVLLRAAAPVAGLDVMRSRRVRARRDRDLCAGPARLCQAFAITGGHDGADLTRGSLRIVDDGVPPPSEPLATARIGLAPGRGDTVGWRFLVPGDPHVSRRAGPAG